MPKLTLLRTMRYRGDVMTRGANLDVQNEVEAADLVKKKYATRYVEPRPVEAPKPPIETPKPTPVAPPQIQVEQALYETRVMKARE